MLHYPGVPISIPGMAVDPFFSGEFTSGTNADIAWTKDYEFIRFLLFGCQSATDGAGFRMRTSADGGSTFDSGATDYNLRTVRRSDTNQIDAGPALAYLPISIDGNGSNAAGETGMFEIMLLNPFDTNRQTQVISSGGAVISTSAPYGQQCFGSRDSAGRVDAVRFYWQFGNWAAGTIIAEGFINPSAL